MSFIADIRVVSKSLLPEIKAIQDEVIEGCAEEDFDVFAKFTKFFEENTRMLGDEDNSGTVYIDLITYLQQKGIDLEHGELSEMTEEFEEATEMMYFFLTIADRKSLLDSMDPSLFSAEEFQAYVAELYHFTDANDYGDRMMEGLGIIYNGLKNLKDDEVINVQVFG